MGVLWPEVLESPAFHWKNRTLALFMLYDEYIPCLFSPRSTSLVIPTHALSWRRPRPGHPGRPSTSLTMEATMSSDLDTHAKPACLTQICWKWEDRESKCGTALVMEPVAAPRMVSGDSMGADPLPRTGMWSVLYVHRRERGIFPFDDFWFSKLSNNDTFRAELAL